MLEVTAVQLGQSVGKWDLGVPRHLAGSLISGNLSGDIADPCHRYAQNRWDEADQFSAWLHDLTPPYRAALAGSNEPALL